MQTHLPTVLVCIRAKTLSNTEAKHYTLITDHYTERLPASARSKRDIERSTNFVELEVNVPRTIRILGDG